MFIDRVVVRWRRGPVVRALPHSAARSCVPMGGPDGGDGGRGGDVIVAVTTTSPHCSTTRYRDRWDGRARRARRGLEQDRAARATTSYLRCRQARSSATRHRRSSSARCSTTARRLHRREGRPGRARATRTSRPPRTSRRASGSRARRARSARLELELKLIADVGLVGRAQRGQAHAALRDLRGAPQDRRLSRSRRSRRNLGVVAAQRPPHVRRRRHPRHHRGRARGEGARAPVSAAHRAHAHPGVPRCRSTRWTGRPSYDQLRREIAAYSRGARRRSRTASCSPSWTC